MMKLKSIAATALLGGLCIAATANTYNLGILDSSAFDTLGMLSDKYAANSVISDDWNFTIGTHSDVSFSALQTSLFLQARSAILPGCWSAMAIWHRHRVPATPC
jgi:hypothetical protein